MKPSPDTPPLLAWDVEIHSMHCIVFAATKPKARYQAVKSYWDAYGQRKGEWPRATAVRRPSFDESALRHRTDQRAWSEDYVLSYPSR